MIDDLRPRSPQPLGHVLEAGDVRGPQQRGVRIHDVAAQLELESTTCKQLYHL